MNGIRRAVMLLSVVLVAVGGGYLPRAHAAHPPADRAAPLPGDPADATRWRPPEAPHQLGVYEYLPARTPVAAVASPVPPPPTLTDPYPVQHPRPACPTPPESAVVRWAPGEWRLYAYWHLRLHPGARTWEGPYAPHWVFVAAPCAAGPMERVGAAAPRGGAAAAGAPWGRSGAAPLRSSMQSCPNPESHYPNPPVLHIRPAPGAAIRSGGPVPIPAPAPIIIPSDPIASPFPGGRPDLPPYAQSLASLFSTDQVRQATVQVSGGNFLDLLVDLDATTRRDGRRMYGAFFAEGGAAALTLGVIDFGRLTDPSAPLPPVVRYPFWYHAARRLQRYQNAHGTLVSEYGTALRVVYLDGRAWHPPLGDDRPSLACQLDPTCAPNYIPPPLRTQGSARLIGPQEYAQWDNDVRQWSHRIWRGPNGVTPPVSIPSIYPSFTFDRVWLEPATQVGVRVAVQPGHWYGVLAQAEAKSCNEHVYAQTLALVHAGDARPIHGMVWDITNPDAPVPANRQRHTVTLEATVGGQTRVVGQGQTDAQGRFTVWVVRDALEALLRHAGITDLDTPVAVRLRLFPNTVAWGSDARYLPVERAAQPPVGWFLTGQSPLTLDGQVRATELQGPAWTDAAFYVARFPVLPPRGPDANLCLHARHATGGGRMETTCTQEVPDRLTWLYGAWLEWRPDVRLTLPPDLPPAFDGYAVQGELTDWTFLGSPPLVTGTGRYGATDTARILWSKHPPSPPPAQGWVARLPSLDVGQNVPLQVRLTYRYWFITPDGVASLPWEAQYDGAVRVTVVAPQGG